MDMQSTLILMTFRNLGFRETLAKDDFSVACQYFLL